MKPPRQAGQKKKNCQKSTPKLHCYNMKIILVSLKFVYSSGQFSRKLFFGKYQSYLCTACTFLAIFMHFSFATSLLKKAKNEVNKIKMPTKALNDWLQHHALRYKCLCGDVIKDRNKLFDFNSLKIYMIYTSKAAYNDSRIKIGYYYVCLCICECICMYMYVYVYVYVNITYLYMCVYWNKSSNWNKSKGQRKRISPQRRVR